MERRIMVMGMHKSGMPHKQKKYDIKPMFIVLLLLTTGLFTAMIGQWMIDIGVSAELLECKGYDVVATNGYWERDGTIQYHYGLYVNTAGLLMTALSCILALSIRSYEKWS